jgi:hypothetical protein
MKFLMEMAVSTPSATRPRWSNRRRAVAAALVLSITGLRISPTARMRSW